MFVKSLTLLLAASYAVIADVKIGTPVAGGNYTAGVANFSLQWVDSGTPPITLNISSYQVFLCAGGNEASNFVSQLVTQSYSFGKPHGTDGIPSTRSDWGYSAKAIRPKYLLTMMAMTLLSLLRPYTPVWVPVC